MVNWAYTEARAKQVTTTTTMGDTAATLNLNADADNYYFWICFDHSGSAPNHYTYVQAYYDGVAEGELVNGLTNVYYSDCIFFKKTATVGAHTVTVKFSTAGGQTGWIRNLSILALRDGVFSDTYWDSTDDPSAISDNNYQTVDTYTFTAEAGNYLIGCGINISGSADSDTQLIDGDSNVIGLQKGKSSQIHSVFLHKVQTLTAGSVTYTLQARETGVGTLYIKDIQFVALKLPDDTQYGSTDDSGTGTRLTLSWTPMINHDVYILDSSDGTTANPRMLYDTDSVAQSEGRIYQTTANGGIKITGDGDTKSFSIYTAGTILRSRLVALDLTTLGSPDAIEPIGPHRLLSTYSTPAIKLEVLPPIGWIGDAVPPRIWKVQPGAKVTDASGSEVSSFSVQIHDPDRVKRSMINEDDPCWIWLYANGEYQRYFMRISEIHELDDTNGETVEVIGLNWAGALALKRGRTVDSTRYNVEVSDGIANTETGLMVMLPEVGSGYYVRNTGQTIAEIYEMRGIPIKSVLDEYKSYASKYVAWSYFFCQGDHKYEYGQQNIHLEKASARMSPTLLVAGKNIFFVNVKSLSDYMDYGIVEQGDWGSTTDVIGQPELGEITSSYATTNQDNDQALYTGATSAAGVTLYSPTEHIMNEVEFYLKKNGSPTGYGYARIYLVTGTPGIDAVPIGSAIASSIPFDVSTLTTSYVRYRLPLVNPVLLGKQQTFATIFEYDDAGGSAANYVKLGTDNTL